MKFRAKLSEFRNAIKEAIKQLTQDGVSQSKRAAHGYALEEPTDYDTGGEGLPLKGLGEVEKEIGLEQGDDEEEEEEDVEEGVTQTKRSNHGYGLEGGVDYNDYKDQPGEGLRMREALGIEAGSPINKKKFKKLENNLTCLPTLNSVASNLSEDEREDWIMSAKPSFKKQYGNDWEKYLYATANKKFGGKK
jgi:biotin operon repressor